MTLHKSRITGEQYTQCKTASVGTTPVAAHCVAPMTGYIDRVFGVIEGTISGTATIAVAIKGKSSFGSFTIAAGGAGTAGSKEFTGSNFAARLVDDGDDISFTPSGATGTAIPAMFHVVIKP